MAQQSLLHFTEYTFPQFEITEFHKVYYRILDLFAKGDIRRLIVSVPPQHGKSEGSSRRLPAYLLGKNPNLNIGILSYAASLARSFNRDVQRVIDTPEYHAVFPDIQLPASMYSTKSTSRAYVRTSEEFEVIGYSGSLRTVGRGGSLTGRSLDVVIIDDLYKDWMEANSVLIRASAIDWYSSVVQKRLHNNSQELIVFTRWHEDDLIGYLERKVEIKELLTLSDLEEVSSNSEKPFSGWVKVNFPALMDREATDLDPREIGEALYPQKHSREKLEEEREQDPVKFMSLNQGNPTPIEGRLYSEFNVYEQKPKTFRIVQNYTDVADRGKDFLCSICYGVGMDNYIYILDIIYTQKSQEHTEPMVARFLERNKVRIAYFESNNGGGGFARGVDRNLQIPVAIKTFHQSENKEARIISNSAEVARIVLFPVLWKSKYPQFAKEIVSFKKFFQANQYDDGADTLTGVLETSGILERKMFALYNL